MFFEATNVHGRGTHEMNLGPKRHVSPRSQKAQCKKFTDTQTSNYLGRLDIEVLVNDSHVSCAFLSFFFGPYRSRTLSECFFFFLATLLIEDATAREDKQMLCKNLTAVLLEQWSKACSKLKQKNVATMV
jgi:hypothetical protein